MLKVLGILKTPRFLTNALLFCIGALLLIVGIDFARVEINKLAHAKKATELAHNWSTQLVTSAPFLPRLLATPRGESKPLPGIGSVQPISPVMGYRIYDPDGKLRVVADASATPDSITDPTFLAQVTLPLTYEGKRVGTIVSDIDASSFHEVLVDGRSRSAPWFRWPFVSCCSSATRQGLPHARKHCATQTS